jgi:hypothetical protein
MIGRWLHPSFKTLNLYHDRELAENRRRRVAAHLADCPKCRDTIQFLRKIDEAARTYPMRDPGADLFQRILDRRESGERVILPMVDPPAPPFSVPRRSARVLFVGGLVVVAATVGFLFGLPELRADRSELLFDPVAPRAGEVIRVVYRPGMLLQGEQRLLMRGRFLTAEDASHGRDVPQVVVAELVRQGRGRYTGEFQLSPDVVFAAFAVENPDGSVVDHNRRQLWELLVHDDQGTPTAAALRKRTEEHFARGPELAQDPVEQLTALYSRFPSSWLARLNVDLSTHEPAEHDMVRAEAGAQFRRLESSLLHHAEVAVSELAAMAELAENVGDSLAAERWQRRLAELEPGHPYLARVRATRILNEHQQNPGSALGALQALWDEGMSGSAADLVAAQAFIVAWSMGLAEETRTWAFRWAKEKPWDRIAIGQSLARWPELRDAGLELLRLAADDSVGLEDERRPLTSTRQQHLESIAREHRRARVALGSALVQTGSMWAGLNLLEVTAEEGWDPTVFRLVAETRLALSDTVAALQMLARVAIDPMTSITESDSLRRLAIERVTPQRWETWISQADRQLRESVLRHSVTLPLPGHLKLVDSANRQHELAGLIHGTVTVVAFWSSQGYAAGQLSTLQTLAGELRARNIGLLAVTADPPSAELETYLRGRGYTFPVYHDPDGLVATAFGRTLLPEYYVLDAAGWVRFEQSSPDQVVRQAVALQEREFLVLAPDPATPSLDSPATVAMVVSDQRSGH